MPTQTCRWPDPEVKHEGVQIPLEHRPRKRRKKQIDWESVLGGVIILFSILAWPILFQIMA